MRLTPDFDNKMRWLYTGGIFFLFLGSIATIARVMLGNPPSFSSNHTHKRSPFTRFRRITSWLCLFGLYKSSVRSPYLLLAATGAFVLAGYICGYAPKLLALLSFSSIAVSAVTFLFGDKSNMDSENKKIKIRLPW